jgi:hypothetical protein
MVRFSPIDTACLRLGAGMSLLTLGVPAARDIEVATFDLADPAEDLTQVTRDGLHKPASAFLPAL